MRGQLNIRLAAVLVIAAVVGIAGLMMLHRWQTGRNAADLLTLARVAEEQGNAGRAARLLSEYLKRNPTDTESRARYGRLLEAQVTSLDSAEPVIAVYERIVADDPSRLEARRRLANLYVFQGRYAEALPHLLAAGAETASDAELATLLASCYEDQGNTAQAEAQYRRATQLDPTRVLPAMRLALLLRQGRSDQAADAVVNQLVAANPNDAEAYLARARYRIRYSTGDAGADLREAIRLAPDNVEARLLAAETTPDAAMAKQQLLAALEQHPGDAQIYAALAGAEARAGQTARAAEVLRDGLARLPGNEKLLFMATDLALDVGDTTEASRLLSEIERWHLAPERTLIVRARLRMAADQWREARDLLLEGRSTLTTANPTFGTDADVLIGRCHERLGEEDLALAAYRRAAAANPNRADAPEGIARVLIRSGRLDGAVELYRRLAASPTAPPEVILSYARLAVGQYLAVPAANRQSQAAGLLLDEVERRVPGSPQLPLLRAEILAADEQWDAARTLLESAVAAHPDSAELALPLARLLDRRGKPTEAQAVLDAVAAKSDSIEIPMARLELASVAQKSAAVAAAESRLPGASPEDRARLAVALAVASSRWNEPAEVRRWWAEVVRLKPLDLGVRLQQFDLAAQTADRNAMAEVIAAVRRIEGADGAVGNYAEAMTHLLRAEDRTPQGLAEARRLLTSAALRRPSWPAVAAARGALAEAEGNLEEALADYLRAIDLGDRHAGVVRRAVQLLVARQRYAEADRVVQRATPSGQLSSQLSRLAAEVSLLNRELDRAVELAGVAVPADSQDYEEYIWQAEILSAAGKTADSEAALRRATSLAADRPEPWAALARHFAKVGKPQQVDTVIAEMTAKLPATQRALGTALCLDAAGRTAAASKAYETAANAQPADTATVRAMVAFQQRAGTPQRAESAIRAYLATGPKPTDVTWARRSLATALAATGRYPAFQEAITLLDRNLADTPGEVADLTAKAQVLATRNAERQNAIDLLQDLSRRGRLGLDAEFLLGQLQSDAGDWPSGRRRMINVLSLSSGDAKKLQFFIERTLQFATPDEAEPWIARLMREAPNESATRRLRATSLARRGRARDAADELSALVATIKTPQSDAERDRLRAVAVIADAAAIGIDAKPLVELAERLGRLAANGGRPVDQLALAEHLGRRGQVDDALKRIRAANAEPTAAGAALLAIAYATPPLSAAQVQAIATQLSASLDGKAGPVETASMTALMMARRGRYAEAAEAFRVVRQANGDAATLNNLAYMLVLSAGATGEIESLLAQATAEVGLTAEILDTRGVARLNAGRFEEAIADLEQAVNQEPTAARCRHLERAYERAGRSDDAKRLATRADKLRGDGSLVLPAERPESPGGAG